MQRTLLALLFLVLSLPVFAQMPAADGTVRYGNEWIDYDATYLRVPVAADGLVRLTNAQLTAAGLAGDDLVLHHDGESVPFARTADGLIFYGERNRGELDRFLFPDPDSMQLNPAFSMHTDTAVYYLTTGAGGRPFAPAPIVGTPQERTDLFRTAETVAGDHYSKSFFRTEGSNSSSIYFSHYELADGFGSRATNDLLSGNGDQLTSVTLPLPGAYGGASTLRVRYGVAFDAHRVEISADGNLLGTFADNEWAVRDATFNFLPSGESVTVDLRGTQGDRDKPNLAFATVTYRATTAFDDDMRSFVVPAANVPTRIRLTDLGAAAGAGTVLNSYAPAAGYVVSATVQADGSAVFDFPASAEDVAYHLGLPAFLSSAPAAAPYSFTDLLPATERTNYLLLTSRRLHGPNVDGIADYRRSPAGGGYTVTVVDVEDLYEAFGYGVARHPMAIRNYVAAARRVAPGLQYLFLVGRGRELPDLRAADDLAAARTTYFLPSFGFPASDNLLTADLGGVTPNLSTGRLAAINDGEVGIYLRKLRAVEAQINQGEQTIADRDWMKQVLHLGGGGTPGEQSSIKSRLARMTDTIELSDMGANVTAFFKTSSEPIEDSRQTAIFDRINNGTGIITFMGHSSSQTFDFSIDDPNNYFNTDRYPFMLSLGCYSGDAFTPARSISERFLFLQDKGAIAFAASKGVGYIGALGLWGAELYGNIGTDTYGMGIGDAMRASIAHFAGTSNFTLGILLEQFALSGDPAYRLHPRPGPDFVVDARSVRFEPEVVPAQDPTFIAELRLLNLGTKADRDSLDLRFRQQLPSGEIVDLLTERVATPAYDDLLRVELPNPGLPAVGGNRIFVSVDASREIDELPLPGAELNNDLTTAGSPGIPLTFIANTAKVAFPPRYAVIGGPVELIASTTDALAAEREYVVQVAADRRFTNLLTADRITSPGGILRYSPALTPTDSTTYYWRISPDSTFTEGAGYIWSESSFTWVAAQPAERVGWAMQDAGQTVDGGFVNILRDTSRFGWSFAKDVTDITNFNAVYRNRRMPRFEFNGQRFGATHEWRIQSGLQVVVIDTLRNTTPFWLHNPGGGEYNSAPGASLVWAFDTKTAAGRAGFIQFLDEAVDPGKYVFVYSVQRGTDIDYFSDDWLADSETVGTTILDVLEEQGALQARALTELGSVPYLFAFQKDFGALTEAIAQDQSDTIVMQTDIFGNWDRGNWVTEPVGPALSWDKIDITISDINLTPDTDSIVYKVYGVANDGVETIVEEDVLPIRLSRLYQIDVSNVSAVTYPYLKVQLDLYDGASRTVATVESVYVDYASSGDVAVNPRVLFVAPDSIQGGEDLVIEAGYQNISRTGMDSLLVELTVRNDLNETTVLRQLRPALAAGGEGNTSFNVNTDSLNGTLRYGLVLNPRQHQPENVTFNNVIESQITLKQDLINPVVDVLFDGERINDGALVSSRPQIRILVRDENEQLLLIDTSAIQLTLTDPSNQRTRISVTDGRATFSPGSEGDNSAEILFEPELLEDGVYRLEVVASDRSANVAGRFAYEKAFEVVNKHTISNVLTYPNPFSDQTRFVYTLTGSELPQQFRIQIMTISGRVVRDIDLMQFEDIKFGTHQTDFAWDGTDEYGDLLANGVYLYRVIASNNEREVFEKRDNGTDQFFARGLGKVVIVR